MEREYFDLRDRRRVVQSVQEALRVLTYRGEEKLPVLAVDGIYGRRSEEAVRTFQHAHRLQENGKVDYETWQLLFALAAAARQKETQNGQPLTSDMPNRRHRNGKQ